MSRLSHRARSCQTTPTPCLDSTDGSAGMTLPASRMDPVVGSMSPPMHRTSVVLPAPFSPARATISPSPTVRLTPSSARTGPKLTARSDTDSSGDAPVTSGASAVNMSPLWPLTTAATTSAGTFSRNRPGRVRPARVAEGDDLPGQEGPLGLVVGQLQGGSR